FKRGQRNVSPLADPRRRPAHVHLRGGGFSSGHRWGILGGRQGPTDTQHRALQLLQQITM
ncbi:MAG: hypothetical protein ACYCT1_01170, partial [Steroidobacteraceae bacterium]